MSEDVYALLDDCATELKMFQDALRETLAENKKLREENLELQERVAQMEWAMGI